MVDVLALLQKKGVIDETLQANASELIEKGESVESNGDLRRLHKILGEYYGLPTRELNENDKIDSAVLQYISEDSARHYGLLPLAVNDGIMEVGITDPDNLAVLDALNFISGKNKLPYKLVLILQRDLNRGLEMYESLSGEVDEALTELETELSAEIEARENESEDHTEHIKEDAPVDRP